MSLDQKLEYKLGEFDGGRTLVMYHWEDHVVGSSFVVATREIFHLDEQGAVVQVEKFGRNRSKFAEWLRVHGDKKAPEWYSYFVQSDSYFEEDYTKAELLLQYGHPNYGVYMNPRCRKKTREALESEEWYYPELGLLFLFDKATGTGIGVKKINSRWLLGAKLAEEGL